jgi:putative hemolysin
MLIESAVPKQECKPYRFTVSFARSAVHPDYRNGAVITLLWAGLARFIEEHGFDYLIGCASISMADGGHAAASIFRRIGMEHMSPIEWRVFPRHRLPLESLDNTLNVPLPPSSRATCGWAATCAGNRRGTPISTPPISC